MFDYWLWSWLTDKHVYPTSYTVRICWQVVLLHWEHDLDLFLEAWRVSECAWTHAWQRWCNMVKTSMLFHALYHSSLVAPTDFALVFYLEPSEPDRARSENIERQIA